MNERTYVGRISIIVVCWCTWGNFIDRITIIYIYDLNIIWFVCIFNVVDSSLIIYVFLYNILERYPIICFYASTLPE